MKGKVAVITGAKTGIGNATAHRFAAGGVKVVIADIEDAEAETRDIAKGGAGALFVRCDVSKDSDVARLFERTLQAFGRVDVLVNNAGVVKPGLIPDEPGATWDWIIGTNLKGPFLCSRAAIPLMQRQGGGVIINIGSEYGLIGGARLAIYAASKGGLNMLTKALAHDHAKDGIRVNCLVPGPVLTPLMEQNIQAQPDPEAKRRQEIDSTLVGRFGTPAEIANVIYFMATDEASFMTGSIVTVDGGVTA